MPKHLFAIGLISSLSILSCSHDAVIPDTPAISFKDEVQPIIVSNCATDGCHSAVNGEEFSLSDYNDIRGHVTAGNARKSDLYKAVTRLSGGGAMPPNGPLSEEQLRSIYVWIMQGAKNN